MAANAMYAVASRIFADAYKPREITRTSCSWRAWVDRALARRRTAEDTIPALEVQTVSESCPYLARSLPVVSTEPAPTLPNGSQHQPGVLQGRLQHQQVGMANNLALRTCRPSHDRRLYKLWSRSHEAVEYPQGRKHAVRVVHEDIVEEYAASYQETPVR